MKYAWKIARVAGVDIRLHVTFPLLLLWVAISQYDLHQRISAVVDGVILTLLIFLMIVLHELGHALTARRYGIRTRDIVLLPVGGLARMDRLHDRPVPELVIALAGPAVNLVLAALLFGALVVWQGGEVLAVPPFSETGLLQQLAWANVALAAFNLLPAFPMDGGRVLRALLALRLGDLRATRIAAVTGQIFAVMLGLAGLIFSPLWIFVALVVWLGAQSEEDETGLLRVLQGVRVGQVMVTDFKAFAEDESLAQVLNHLLATCQEDFPVRDASGRFAGLLRRKDVLACLSALGTNAPVSAVMKRDALTAAASDTVEALLARWMEDRGECVPVLQDGRIVGLFTAANLAEYVFVQMTLGDRGTTAAPTERRLLRRWKAILAH